MTHSVFGGKRVRTITMANNFRHRFDFDIGYLIKSPCKDCVNRYLFPDCMDDCMPLDRIHTVLANTVSCSRSLSPIESSAIFNDTTEKKQ